MNIDYLIAEKSSGLPDGFRRPCFCCRLKMITGILLVTEVTVKKVLMSRLFMARVQLQRYKKRSLMHAQAHIIQHGATLSPRASTFAKKKRGPRPLGSTPESANEYGSTLYIGMDEVLAHYACTFENSDLHSHNPLLTPQDDSQGQYVCVLKIWLELDH